MSRGRTSDCVSATRPAITAPELRDDLLIVRSKFPLKAIGKRMIAPPPFGKTKI
jgi:hypothetical protein